MGSPSGNQGLLCITQKKVIHRSAQYLVHGGSAAVNRGADFVKYLARRSAPERIRIDRESEASHDLIQWLDEPGM